MENIKIKILTYNVGDKSADQCKPDELFNFVQLRKFDFIFIGLQEVVQDNTWTALIKKCFGEQNYVLVKVRNIWAIWLYLLAKRSRLPQIDNVESELTASGYAGVMGNKGGASIRFKYQGISIIGVNGHFTAHEEAYKDRLNDYLDIISRQSFRDEDVNNILDHDIVFWMGDLNFRIEKLSKEEIEKCIKEKSFAKLAQNDQLNKAMKDHEIFKDFKEGDLNFPPTFKFDDDSDTYDTSKKQRKPAWTDRILYLTHNDDNILKPNVELLKYYHEPHIRGSDHRPVCAEFKITFNLISPQRLPIEFIDVPKVWNADKDQVVTYRSLEKINNNKTDDDHVHHTGCFRPDRWDWIGLVRSNWTILSEDTITYVYVTCTCEHDLQNKATIKFEKKYLGNISPKTELQLLYFSKRKNYIQGISNVFSFA